MFSSFVIQMSEKSHLCDQRAPKLVDEFGSGKTNLEIPLDFVGECVLEDSLHCRL